MKKDNLFLILVFLIFSFEAFAQPVNKPIEVLLIGTFHFNNPGADLAKTDKFDVLSKNSQAELDHIAKKIKDFGPTKIFVEWDFNDSNQLDSLYQLYLANKYFEYINEKFPKSSFYKENEIFQLGFRAAKQSGNKKIYGIDIQNEFPFDSLMLSIDKAKQTALKEKIFNRIKEFENIGNQNRKKYSLTDIILESNKQSNRNFDLGSYISMFNRGGLANDFTGPDLVANWYKRNLLMYSFVQKQTDNNDDRIVILLGSSHIALFKHFIDLDENFKAVELKDVLNKK